MGPGSNLSGEKITSAKILTATLLIRSIHAVPVTITHIVRGDAAVVRALELSWMACAPQICYTQSCLLTACPAI